MYARQKREVQDEKLPTYPQKESCYGSSSYANYTHEDLETKNSMNLSKESLGM
jgi:hypothetical protein